jgi:uncharacterized protein
MLKYDLSEIMRNPGMSKRYEVKERPFVEDDVKYVSPVIGRFTVTNGGSALVIRGNISTLVELECGRCLSEMHFPVDAEITEEFSLSDAEAAVSARDMNLTVVQDDENEVPPGLFEDHVMNFAVLIRQAAILEIPLSPLCQEECRGLCPSCGKNRNENSCQCDALTTSKPLSRLADLIRQKESRN